MIKLLITSALAIGATLGGAYYGALSSRSSSTAAEAAKKMDFETFRIDPVAVPTLRSGKVHGYVVVAPAIIAETEAVKKQKSTITLFVNEATVRTLFEEQAFDFNKLQATDLAKLTGRIVEQANQRMGGATIKDVLFESINFLKPDEIRAVAKR